MNIAWGQSLACAALWSGNKSCNQFSFKPKSTPPATHPSQCNFLLLFPSPEGLSWILTDLINMKCHAEN